jgi:hypothetical protein
MQQIREWLEIVKDKLSTLPQVKNYLAAVAASPNNDE